MIRRCIVPGLILLALAMGVREVEVAHGTVPINFTRGTVAGAGFASDLPTSIAVGPDGRLYVANSNGQIQALTLNANKQVTAVQQLTTATQLQEVFGIAFDPTDGSVPAPLYVTNTISGFGDASPGPASGDPGSYAGKITKIHGAGYGTRTDIITGLPISNSGHEANGLAFDATGKLYIAQGGTTNGGVIDAGGTLFQRDEVPTGGAILYADIDAGGFNGNITYNPPDVYSNTVDQTGGNVTVHASGLRNPYDLVFHSNGKLYVTDNGPNDGYGPPSTSCTTQGATDAAALDELNLIVAGAYYGHPNRNRGLAGDARQCVYHPGTEASNGGYTAPILANLPASTDGMAEYKSNKFGGQMQGDLLMAAWVNSQLLRVKLSADGQSVVEQTVLAEGLQNALDVAVDADGTIYVAEYSANRVTFFKPDETPVSSISVTGIQPNAGPTSGGQQVTITGTNFTTTAETSVTIGGAALQNVVVHNSTTIKGTTPPSGTTGAKNVVVTSSGLQATLTNGYTYAAGGGTTPPVANAGPDVSSPIAHNDHAHVTLDGRASFDPDGFITQYEWKEGSTVLSTNSVDSIQFTLGTHIITLTVWDNENPAYTHSDEMRVIITSTAENPEKFYCFDVDGNAVVNAQDLGLVAQQFGKTFGQPGYTRLRDWNANRVINAQDLGGTAQDFTSQCPLVDQQIRASIVGTEFYSQNINNAFNAGYFQATPFIPGQGRHLLRTGNIPQHDLIFEPGNPESLLYEPSASTPGGWKLGGLMYIIPYSLTPLPPDGFATTEDAWHYHNWLCVWNNGSSVQENVPQSTCLSRPGNPVWNDKAGWLVHIWAYDVNPVGRFVEVNPEHVGGP